MDAASAIVQGLGSPEASVEIYDAAAGVSTVARLAAAARSKLQVMRIATGLRRTNRSLKNLFDLVDDIQSGKRRIELAAESVTPQQLQNVVENLEHIARMIDFLCESMRGAGLTNNSLTAAGLQTLNGYGEPLRDLVDWLDALSKPEFLKSVFERAKEEKERGALVDLAKIE
jgi:hypothetical protein